MNKSGRLGDLTAIGHAAQRGTALVIAIVFMGVFATLIVTIYVMLRSSIEGAIYEKKSAQALALAEAGLEDGILRIKYNAFCTPTSVTNTLDYGSYTLTLAPTLPISISSAVSNEVPIDVTSEGKVTAVFPWRTVHRTLTARIQPQRTAFQYGIFSTTGTLSTGTGTALDSYDSRVNLNPSTFTSNSTVTSNGRITFTQNTTTIFGDASYFTPPAPSTAQVSGSIQQLSQMAPVEVMVSTSDLVCNNNLTGIVPSTAYDPGTKALTATSAVQISPGLYHLSSITVGPGASLTTTGTGRVDIHLTGSLSARGPITNSSQKPSDFVIQGVSGSLSSVSLDYNGNFFGVLLVSSQPVTLGSNVQFFGNLVAASITLLDGSAVHYDLALSTKTASQEGVYLGKLSVVKNTWVAKN